MKKPLGNQLIVGLFGLAGFLLSPQSSAQAQDRSINDFLVLNDKSQRTNAVNLNELGQTRPLSVGELARWSLQPQDSEIVVVSYKDVAVWIENASPGAEEKLDKFDRTNGKHFAGGQFLKELLTREAIGQAILEVNESEGRLLSQTEIQKKATDPQLREAIKRSGLTAKLVDLKLGFEEPGCTRYCATGRFITADFYLSVKRDVILADLSPPPVDLSFTSPPLKTSDFSSENTYVVRIVDQRFPIAKDPNKPRNTSTNEVYEDGFKGLLFDLSKKALGEAIVEVNRGLGDEDRIRQTAVERLVADYTAPGQDLYQPIVLLTSDYEIRKQRLWPKGSLIMPEGSTRTRNATDLVEVTVYFYLNREKIKQLIIPPWVSKPLFEENVLIRDPVRDSSPNVDENRFIATYSGIEVRVREDLPTPTRAREVALAEAKGEIKAKGLDAAIKEVRTQLEFPIGQADVQRAKEEIAQRERDFIKEFAWLGEPQVVSRGPTSTAPEKVRVSAYVSIDRTALKNLLLPPKRTEPVRTVAASSVADSPPPFDRSVYVALFRDRTAKVPTDYATRDEAREVALRNIESELRAAALREASEDIRKTLVLPVGERELAEALKAASKREGELIQVFRWLGQPMVESRGDTSTAPETLMYSAYVSINREVLKDIIQPPERAVDLAVDRRDVANVAPTASDRMFVRIFRDIRVDVPNDFETKDRARQEALDQALLSFKLEALGDAASEIARALRQPIDERARERTMKFAENRVDEFIEDYRWLGAPQVITRGAYSTAPEKLVLSAYIAIDNKTLENLLIEERVISIVGKYRTYVELFWNDELEVEPDPINTLIATIENDLRDEGYEVVEFERIAGDLRNLLTNEDEAAELYAADELKRFKANLELRNIGSRFVQNKRVLAEYADVLIGVTVNTLRLVKADLIARVTVDATFFSGGEWQKLASKDATHTLPYDEGRSDLEDLKIGILQEAGQKALKEVKGQIQEQLALRKGREEMNLDQEREFTVVFSGTSKDMFGKIRKRLRTSEQWTYKRADFGSRSVYLSYAGGTDALSDAIQTYLEDVELDPGLGEFASGTNRILFGE